MISRRSLDPGVFWRVHRSYLVNINKIKEIVPWFSRNYILKMNDGKATEIPVSRSQTQAAAGVSAPLTPSAVCGHSASPPARPPAACCRGARLEPHLRRRGSTARRSRRRRAVPSRRRGAHPRPVVATRTDRLGAPGRGAPHLVQDAGLGRGLRHAHRHVRLPGRARRRPEHVADARRPGPADRQQADLPAERHRIAATS